MLMIFSRLRVVWIRGSENKFREVFLQFIAVSCQDIQMTNEYREISEKNRKQQIWFSREIEGAREQGLMLDLLIHVASSVTEYQTNSQGHLGMDHPLRTIVLTTQGWYVHTVFFFFLLLIFSHLIFNWSIVFSVGSSLCFSGTFDDSSLGVCSRIGKVNSLLCSRLRVSQSLPAFITIGGRDEKKQRILVWENRRKRGK